MRGEGGLLVALAVLLEAVGLLASASPRVVSLVLELLGGDLGGEGHGVARLDRLDGGQAVVLVLPVVRALRALAPARECVRESVCERERPA